MRRTTASVVAGLALLVSALPVGAAEPEGPVYVALGDSNTIGRGIVNPEKLGFVPVLHRWLKSQDCTDSSAQACPHLEMVNLSVSGATSDELIAEQLPLALELINQRNGDDDPNNDVTYITLQIGGNDLIRTAFDACAAGINPQCVELLTVSLGLVEQNLAEIIGSLQTAAGPETTIVVLTYDNAFETCVLAQVAPVVDYALEGGPGLPMGLNDVIEAAALDAGAEVVDLYGQLADSDWVGGNDCAHPDISGYHRIAQLIYQAID